MKSRRVRLSDIAELTVGFVGNMAKQYKDEGKISSFAEYKAF